jgi:Zn finger protein HypA/HybF involved in hydrogenase expression
MNAKEFDQSQREFLFENFSDLQGHTLRFCFGSLALEAETLEITEEDAWTFYYEIQHGMRCVWCGNQGELDGSDPHCDDCHERTCVG